MALSDLPSPRGVSPLSSIAATPRALGYRMPAEWEPHEATWLSWPKDPVTWPNRVPRAQEAFACMIEALTPHEQVHLLVDDVAAERQALAALGEKNIFRPNLKIHHVATVDSWIRDYGPNFLLRDSKNPSFAKDASRQAYNCWIFNAWGGKYEALMADNGIARRLAELGDMPSFEPGIVLEGGSIDVNGLGTVLTTEQCLLNKNRNPNLSKEQIEDYLKNFLGAQKILWLGEGIAGDDTDGHIDDIARFVAPDTIVTAVETNRDDVNFLPLRENLRLLRTLTDQDGRPFRIVELPMPGLVESDEGRLPASYANFYIANRVVLVPLYSHPHDALAMGILQEIFLDRKVIGIDCRDLVWGMGAIHCVTQQQPLGKIKGKI